MSAELEDLRAAAVDALGELADGVEIETTSLLRRQIARRCIYGVDLNAMAVELARLGVWIHTFVPGLPLSFLDHNLVQGNSLTGVGSIAEAVQVLEPETSTAGMIQVSVFSEILMGFLGRAEKSLRRLALTTDATRREIAVARAAHEEALAAVEPVHQLFDIVVAARLGRTELPVGVNEEQIAKHPGLTEARAVAKDVGALHFPVVFPEVFLRERPGFDCILGNPPWEEVMVDEHSFWALRFPGIRAMTAATMSSEIERLRKTRSDLLAEYESEVRSTDSLRALLSRGQYPQMNEGNADLYKAFCWRFWDLARSEGAIGVVLPRSAFTGAGSRVWREAVLERGRFADVTLLLNNRGWVFDDVHEQYVVGLASIRKGSDYAGQLEFRGPFESLESYLKAMRIPAPIFQVSDFRTWSDGASFPLLPTAQAVSVFLKLRRHPSLGAIADTWRARPLQGDFNATTDRRFFVPGEGDESLWPVYRGASFNIWEPDTGVYYAWARPQEVTSELQAKRERQQRNHRSPVSEFEPRWSNDVTTLPAMHARIAFRDVTNRLNARTVIAALVPPQVILTNQAPYLLWPSGSARDQAYLLGILCSIPLDWYARRTVERHLNFHLFNALPIPRVSPENPLRQRIEEIAGMLAAVDSRFSSWAGSVGVSVASVATHDRAGLAAELDAAVGLLYGLDEQDLRHIFATFHVGWQYLPRLAAVLGHFESLAAVSKQ